MSEIKHFTDANFSGDIATGVILVDFHADWCGPCRMLAPVLEEVAKEVVGKAMIGKVDIDSEQKTASKFQITSVPTMIIFKDGKEEQRIVGLRTKDEIKKILLSLV